MHGWWYGRGCLFVQCKWEKKTFVELVHLKGMELGWYCLKCSTLDICEVGLAFIPLKFIFGMWLIYIKMLACISYPLILILIVLLWPQNQQKIESVIMEFFLQYHKDVSWANSLFVCNSCQNQVLVFYVNYCWKLFSWVAFFIMVGESRNMNVWKWST
jgi:hypothetical protein